jgi:hypothetical protein
MKRRCSEFLRSEKGVSLLEALLAIGLLCLVLSPIFAMVRFNLMMGKKLERLTVARYLAQREMENLFNQEIFLEQLKNEKKLITLNNFSYRVERKFLSAYPVEVQVRVYPAQDDKLLIELVSRLSQ